MQMANEHGATPQDKDQTRQQQKPKRENEPSQPKDREQASDSSAGKGNAGNFANDPERARKTARKDNQKDQS
jgi:hypothetical protein